MDGNNVPTVDNLYALSELFQVPIDAMVRGNRESLSTPLSQMKKKYMGNALRKRSMRRKQRQLISRLLI